MLKDEAIKLAVKLYLEKNTWEEITEEIQKSYDAKYETIRAWVRRSEEYKERNQTKQEDFERSSIEYKKDGTIISEKFITLRDCEDLTPERLLQAHGLDASKWEVMSYKNNMWNTQVKGGAKQISYQSKLSAKPKTQGISLLEIDKHFKTLERKPFNLPTIKALTGEYMAEVNIADLHLGKLCWHGDTEENFDSKIAEALFYELIARTIDKIKTEKLRYITFVWSNDFFNSDNPEQTTTGGTRQDTDLRWQKLFNTGGEMLVRGIEELSKIAKVKTFYTPSNHDFTTGYYALKFIEAWFRNNKNVAIETSARPRKYELFGKSLLGFTHGDKENSKGSKEKASRLASCMPIEAPDLWAKATFREMHTAHLHSEHMFQEINGVIVRRISSPTATDSWHAGAAYIGSVRKSQTFLWHQEDGLLNMINIPVRKK